MNPAMQARLQITAMMIQVMGMVASLSEEMEKNPKAATWVLITVGMGVGHAHKTIDILNQPHVVAAPAGRCIFY